MMGGEVLDLALPHLSEAQQPLAQRGVCIKQEVEARTVRPESHRLDTRETFILYPRGDVGRLGFRSPLCRV